MPSLRSLLYQLLQFALFTTLLLFATAQPAHAATCPTYSLVNGPAPQWTGSLFIQQLNVTYGNCALNQTTATIELLLCSGAAIPFELDAVDSNTGNVMPMPSWVTFQPSIGSYTCGQVPTISMTIDPSKGGGAVLLVGYDWCGGADSAKIHDPNGNTLTLEDNGAGGCKTIWWLNTDAPSKTQPTGSSLDLGPSFPRSGCEGQCGSPINLTNGNTWVQAGDYQLPGLGGGLSLRRTWNSEWLNNSPFVQAGMFGDSWQSTFEKRMQVLSSGTQLRYWRGDGSAWLFNVNRSTYTLASPLDERATLTFSKSTGYTLTLRDGSQELFNTNGFLTALLDRNGNKTTLAYDSSNRVSQATDAAGRVLQFTYNPTLIQQVASIRDSVGTIATYSYDTGSRLTSVTYSDGFTINYSYDANGLLLNVTDTLGKVLEAHTFDSARRGLSSQRANGAESLTISYSLDGTGATLTDSVNNSTNYYGGYRLGSRRYLTGVQGTGCESCVGRGNQSFAYDGTGNRISSQDPNGNKTTFAYDSNGNVTQVSKTLSVGTQAWNYTYNSFGEVLTATDPLGKITTNTYDTKGNLLTVKTPLGNTTTFTYDTKGELLTIKDPRLNVTTLTYTAAGLIASIKDAQNNLTQYQYDARGNRTAVIDALNHTTSFAYDSRNRLTRITYPDTTTTQFGYDYRGRRTSVTDQNSKVTTYAYDDADRLTSVTDAASNVTSYAYDTENNLTQITDAALNKTSFAYDALGRVTTTTFPSNLTETYGYDSNGNLTSKTDRKSQVINYGYDAANRLTSKTYPDNSSVSFTYDLANRLTQVADPTGSYGFTFDADGRLTATSTSYAFLTGRTFTAAYGYDAASNRTSFTDPENGSTTYAYDTLNRLQTLTPPSAFAATGNFGFSYDALSRRTQMTRPNSVTTNYAYDNLSRLTSVLHQLSGSTIDGATYTLDNAGNRTAKTDQRTAVATSYGYDSIYQLLSATQGATTTESYAYDAVGNRTSSLGVASYTTNSSNEMTANSNASFTYDLNGNETSKTDSTGTTNYTWDYENRLTTVTLPASGGTVTFKYDPFGRRIYKSSSSGTSIFAYDGDNVIEETNSSGAVVARYEDTQNIDEPLTMLRSGATSYYHLDGLGSVTSLSNPAGSATQTYGYDSFGKQTSSSGSLTNPFQYTAREFDPETGLYFYRARYYDQSSGRFLGEDSIGFDAGDSNFYRYVANSPVDFVDRSGNQIIPTVGPGAQGGLDLTDYYMALKYLRGDPTCRRLINKLERSPRIFHLEFIRNGDDDYDPNTRTIHWDPRSALNCTHGGRQSPALGLCHEMAHAAGDGPIAQHMSETPDNQYDTREERRVIRTFETPFAIRNGEGVRHDHGGQPVVVPLPVSH